MANSEIIGRAIFLTIAIVLGALAISGIIYTQVLEYKEEKKRRIAETRLHRIEKENTPERLAR